MRLPWQIQFAPSAKPITSEHQRCNCLIYRFYDTTIAPFAGAMPTLNAVKTLRPTITLLRDVIKYLGLARRLAIQLQACDPSYIDYGAYLKAAITISDLSRSYVD